MFVDAGCLCVMRLVKRAIFMQGAIQNLRWQNRGQKGFIWYLSYSCDKIDIDPYNISTMEIGSFWESVSYIKNPNSPLNWYHVFIEVQIFSRRYCVSLWVNGLQSFALLNFMDDSIVWEFDPGRPGVVQLWPNGRILFQTFIFDSL